MRGTAHPDDGSLSPGIPQRTSPATMIWGWKGDPAIRLLRLPALMRETDLSSETETASRSGPLSGDPAIRRVASPQWHLGDRLNRAQAPIFVAPCVPARRRRRDGPPEPSPLSTSEACSSLDRTGDRPADASGRGRGYRPRDAHSAEGRRARRSGSPARPGSWPQPRRSGADSTRRGTVATAYRARPRRRSAGRAAGRRPEVPYTLTNPAVPWLPTQASGASTIGS
jgi:hypothetical protein